MPNPRMKDRRVVHKSTAGILTPIPEAVDLVGNPPPGLTTNTVALLQQRGTANRRARPYDRLPSGTCIGFLFVGCLFRNPTLRT
jgi:hypothetical protein